MKGQKAKDRPKKAVIKGRGKPGPGAKAKAKANAKANTKGNTKAKANSKWRKGTVSAQSRSGSGIGTASAAGKEPVSGGKGIVGRGIGKRSASGGTRASSARPAPVTPSVEKVREEARVLADGIGWVEPGFEYRLPDSYGKDRIVAMSRDPYWVFVYWEITEAAMSRALQSLGREQQNARRILRVYTRDVEGEGKEAVLFDIFITPEARNWYINVGGPGRAYRVDAGLLTTAGKFVCIVSSNVVSTPRDRMSDVLDEKWMSLSSEYEEMYALSGGLTRGVSSPELHERLARELEARLASPLFSPGIREVPGEKEEAKPFWFVVDTDLIVYGATVPGSALTVDGGDCRLREDGTFSFRCHLPDGTKAIDVSVRSADRKSEEHATLSVNRATRQRRG